MGLIRVQHHRQVHSLDLFQRALKWGATVKLPLSRHVGIVKNASATGAQSSDRRLVRILPCRPRYAIL